MAALSQAEAAAYSAPATTIEGVTQGVQEAAMQNQPSKTQCRVSLDHIQLRKIAVPQPNLRKPQGATPLHRGHTGHQHARRPEEEKANAGKLRASIPPPPPGGVDSPQSRVREAGGHCEAVGGGHADATAERFEKVGTSVIVAEHSRSAGNELHFEAGQDGTPPPPLAQRPATSPRLTSGPSLDRPGGTVVVSTKGAV